MLKNNYAYVAILTYDDDGICIDFPDLPGCCPCADKDDTEMALKNAKEALGLHMWGIEQDRDPIPDATPITGMHLEKNQVPVLIDVFMPPIRERINNKSVNRTVTLPAWLNAAALERGINFSQLLQESIKKAISCSDPRN